MIVKVSADICGRTLSLETGKLALQAEGSVMVRYGNTAILTTSVARYKADPKASYFPLSVEVVERFYAAGKIKGSRFVKREGRPSDWAVLTARLTDRPIRPLFPKEARNEVQIVSTILSVDFANEPEMMSVIGASAALSMSAAPFMGPVAGVTVGYIDGQVVVNPTSTEMTKSSMTLNIAGTADAIMMVECGANEVSENIMIDALAQGHAVIKQIVALQNEFIGKLNVKKKPFQQKEVTDVKAQELETKFGPIVEQRLIENMNKGVIGGDMRTKNLFNDLYETEVEALVDDDNDASTVEQGIFNLVKKHIRRNVLNQSLRADGRKLDEIRTIECEVGLLTTNHGSALFTRGGTQALTITTLGSSSDAQIIDGANIEDEVKKRYIHHYNAAPYSVGETGRMMGPKRREIGHGALAERALEPVIPSKEVFPYTVMVVSEVLSQNGSSSMASVCGSTLSLMDAGVPIRKPVAGIAMGLIYESADKYAILSDIQGTEDFCGDMDFKVAGTDTGITALQMDIKIKGISLEIMTRALEQARIGRLHILNIMQQTLSEPRADISPYAPKISVITINPDKIRDVIGSGGKIINKIIADTGVEIDIEDDGTVMVSGVDQEMVRKALAIIKNLTMELEVGTIYEGKVVRIMDFGAFVELPGGKDGLIHISELAPFRVGKVEDIVKMGDSVKAKLIEIDSQGRLRLSKRQAETQN